MFRKSFAITAFCFIYGGFLFLHVITLKNYPETSLVSEVREKTINLDFANYNKKYPPPDWWIKLNETDAKKYPLFKLSQDYPINEPSRICPPKECKWKEFDYRTQSREYLIELLKYAFAGNLEIDWRLPENRARRWVHAPWMDTTEHGREFIHGLTKERHLCKEELLGETVIPCPTARRDIENWAVGFYNERGAYYIGKVWQEVLKDKPDGSKFPPGGFPEGTVSLKLLFTKAEKEKHKADFLENSFEWQVASQRKQNADLSETNCLSPAGIDRKCVDVVRLLQVDVAVRDDRAPTGWVFGTFIYNHAAPPILPDYEFPEEMSESEKENLRRWLKLEIVGLMFGNDEKVKQGGELSESVINNQIGVKQKLGCGGRLNGVVDNPVSSCMSCHAFAETAQNLEPAAMPYDEIKTGCREENFARLFRNIKPRSETFTERTFTEGKRDKEIFSLDYSLQLREGITRYCEENAQKCGWSVTKNKTLFGVTRSGFEKLIEKLKVKIKDN